LEAISNLLQRRETNGTKRWISTAWRATATRSKHIR
jgi:hypothetical protein